MYQSKTFDWQKVIAGLENTTRQITGLPVIAESKVGSKPSYPFISYKIENPYSSDAFAINKTDDSFTMNISFNCWAESEGEAHSISDDLRTLFFDDKYRELLRQAGIVPVEILNISIRSEAMTSFMKVTNEGFDLRIRLHRHYRSDYPILTEITHKGSVN